MEEHWSSRASCKDAPLEIFFPETEAEVKAEAWRPYCRNCPVLAQCAWDARDRSSFKVSGVWGGRYIPPPPAENPTGKNYQPTGAIGLLGRGVCHKGGHKIDSEADLIVFHEGKRTRRYCRVCYIAKHVPEGDRNPVRASWR